MPRETTSERRWQSAVGVAPAMTGASGVWSAAATVTATAPLRPRYGPATAPLRPRYGPAPAPLLSTPPPPPRYRPLPPQRLDAQPVQRPRPPRKTLRSRRPLAGRGNFTVSAAENPPRLAAPRQYRGTFSAPAAEDPPPSSSGVHERSVFRRPPLSPPQVEKRRWPGVAHAAYNSQILADPGRRLATVSVPTMKATARPRVLAEQGLGHLPGGRAEAGEEEAGQETGQQASATPREP
jgi:hypothetical protein